MDQEIDKQDNEPLSPGGLVDILEDLYILLHPHQTARNRKVYPTGIKIQDKELKEISLTPEKFHGEWNYTIKPKENTKFT